MSDDVDPQRCDFCRHDVVLEPVTMAHEGRTYQFCSEACRDALAESQFVFAEYHGYRRFAPGVAGLDGRLPQGMPRNSFVLVSGMAGTRDAALQAELAWRALRRGEPVVMLTYREPPGAAVQRFLELGWNVLPYLEAGDLRLVDCFTYRVEDRERMFDRLSRWNRHLYGVVEDATVTADASEPGQVQNKLDEHLGAAGMSDRGLVIIDSLTELGTLVQPVRAYDFVKDVRADVCKGRYVPVFAGATFAGDQSAFPHDLQYVADGVVQLELNGDIVEDTLVKRLRIRKMSGVLAIPEWTAYEFTRKLGLVTFDPREGIEAAREGATGDDGNGGNGGNGENGGEPAGPPGGTGGGHGPEGTPDDAGPGAGATADAGEDAG